MRKLSPFITHNKEATSLVSSLKLPLGVLLGAASLMLNAAPANQLPTAPTVTAGQTSISQAGNQLTISQTTKFASVNWDSFSIGKDSVVSINMPSSDSIGLQRVTGSAATVIAGQLTSNGRVFLSNSAGILFAKGARVDTAALLATTKDITDWNTERTSVKLIGDSSASVLNEGSLKVTDGGFVILAAAKVINNGGIEAQLGNVALAAGDTIELNFGGNSSLSVSITKGHLDALVSNRDAIIADGGKVILTAKGAESAANSVVNNSGLIRAQSIQNKNGRIYLVGDGTTEVDGTLDASAPTGGNGGFIETSAPQLRVAPTALVTTLSIAGKTGTWLLDPADFFVTDGVSPLSNNGIGNTTLSNALNLNNVEITSASVGGGISDIYIEAPVSWSAATNLKLSANSSIYINAPITVSNAAGSLSLEFGLGAVSVGNLNDYYAYAPVNLPAGNSFTTKHGSDGLTNTFLVVTQLGTFGDTSGTTLQGLQPYINSQPGPYAFIALGADIDATPTQNWDSFRGFLPLNGGVEFAGLGHRVNGLSVSRTSSDAGLFGSISGIIKDVGVTNAYISGGNASGPIAGNGAYAAFINCYSSNCKVVSSTSGPGNGGTGGIAGSARFIDSCYAENVEVWASNGYRAGGITGVTVNYTLGGRLGDMPVALIRNSWSSGIVHGRSKIGGIIGTNFGHVADSYSLAYVYSDYTGYYDVGGIIGENWYGSASGCYSMSNIAGTSQSSLGANSFTNCYASYQSTQFGVSGVTSFGNGNERAKASYTNFDFGTIWWMKEGATRPMLRSEARKYIGNSHQLQLMELQRSANYTLLYNLDLTNDLVDNNAYYRNIWSGNGFVPIGVSGAGFTGSFDGNGKTVNSLVINTPSIDRIGLFGTLTGGTIRNITLTNASVTGNALVGQLVGINEGGSIIQGHSNGTSSGVLHVGGLVGGAYGNSVISDSSSTGTVNNSGSRAGGLVGENFSETSVIRRSYSKSTVNGASLVGGLVGYQVGDIFDSYARGNVNGGTDAGGLIGRIDSGTLSRVFSSGRVEGTSGLGGLVGRNASGNFTYAYWELENSNMSTSAAGTSFTYSNKAKHSTYAGFDFVNTWGISVNLSYQDTYPELRSQTSSQYLQTPIFVKAAAGSSVYGESPSINYSLYYQADGSGQTVTGAAVSGSPTWNGIPASSANVSSYNLTYSGGLSVIFTNGYYAILSENPTAWQVTKRPVQVTANAASKTYGNADPSLGFNLQSTSIGVGLINADTTTGTLSRATGESVGNYAINQGTLTVTNSANYDVTFVPANLSIGRRAVSLSAQAASKTYGDSDPILAGTITAGSLGSVTVSDSLTDLTGTFSRATGESVGNYAISLGSGSKAANYDVTFVPANLSVERRAVTLSTQAVSKTYGEADPSLTATLTSGSLGYVTVSDSLTDLTGTLTRAMGESVGSYAISLGSGSMASNYDIFAAPADLTITRRSINVQALSGQKRQGSADTAFQFTNSNLFFGDTLTGDLTRTPGEVPGVYSILQGTLDDANNGNYLINFQGASYTITNSNILYFGMTDDAKTFLPQKPIYDSSLSRDKKLPLSRGQMSPSDEQTSTIYLVPTEITPAQVNDLSPVEVLNGGVRLPDGVTQSYYLKN